MPQHTPLLLLLHSLRWMLRPGLVLLRVRVSLIHAGSPDARHVGGVLSLNSQLGQRQRATSTWCSLLRMRRNASGVARLLLGCTASPVSETAGLCVSHLHPHLLKDKSGCVVDHVNAVHRALCWSQVASACMLGLRACVALRAPDCHLGMLALAWHRGPWADQPCVSAQS